MPGRTLPRYPQNARLLYLLANINASCSNINASCSNICISHQTLAAFCNRSLTLFSSICILSSSKSNAALLLIKPREGNHTSNSSPNGWVSLSVATPPPKHSHGAFILRSGAHQALRLLNCLTCTDSVHSHSKCYQPH